MSDGYFQEIWNEAQTAGLKAGKAATPVPMIVGEAAGLDSDEFKEGATLYRVDEGACGFAWVNVRPGTSRFARWLKKMSHGRTDPYAGGVTIWISEHGQSVARKEAHAQAMAEVLREAGVKCFADSRLD
ncbi:hypothetical protein LCGC14_2700090 [marine sediment metagenome]|uniref:Uncharacterized protein n=1 Tax=marine sediment metagenome TaxID=412755 RepID=A0A0F9BQA9_9ZZZZ